MPTGRRFNDVMCFVLLALTGLFFTGFASGQFQNSDERIPLFVAESKHVERGTFLQLEEYQPSGLAIVRVKVRHEVSSGDSMRVFFRETGAVMAASLASQLKQGDPVEVRIIKIGRAHV